MCMRFEVVYVCVSPLLNANQWVAQAERLSNPIAAPLCPSTPIMQCSKAGRYGAQAARCCGWLVMLLAHNLLINFLLASLSVTTVYEWEVCPSVTAYCCVCKYVCLSIHSSVLVSISLIFLFDHCFSPRSSFLPPYLYHYSPLLNKGIFMYFILSFEFITVVTATLSHSVLTHFQDEKWN